jgi:hypothetical protein
MGDGTQIFMKATVAIAMVPLMAHAVEVANLYHAISDATGKG